MRTRSLSFVVVMLAIVAASPAAFATLTNLTTGVQAGVGIAADPSGSEVYYTEWNGGTLRRITLNPPNCSAPGCPVTTIASLLAHPQDVALDTVNNAAYVTTRDDVGTTGSLWRISLTPPFPRSLITFNLGAPHQIALDVATDTAWVVGYDVGILWKIQLSTGSKVAVISGLQKPVGLIVNAARTRAYVTEETAQRVNEIDLALGTSLRTIPTGPTPFYAAWAEPTQSSLYVVRRSQKDLLRVDLPTGITTTALSGLPNQPSGVVLSPFSSGLFIAADTVVARDDLGVLPATEPVFLGIGNIPATDIDAITGYATTQPGYFLQVKDAPFGGALNIFGNFTTFATIGTHYRVMVSDDGGTSYTPLIHSWTMSKWDPVNFKYQAFTIVPDSQGRYAIPAEYPATPHRLLPVFLMMRWPTGANGLYKLKVEVYQLSGTTFIDKTPLLPAPTSTSRGNEMTVLVDNDPPIVSLVNIFQHNSSVPINACAIVDSPVSNPAFYDFVITASDPNGHLLSYDAVAYWGNNKSGTVIPAVGYAAQNGPRQWYGVTNHKAPMPNGWAATCDCAHTFFVRASKRTTDGYAYILSSSVHRSITIKNTGVSCP